MSKVKILSTQQIRQKLNRLAYEVYENNFSEKELFIVGIDGNGYKIAQNLVSLLGSISSLKLKFGKISINKDEPWNGEPVTDFEEKDYVKKCVVLVDDVLTTGATVGVCAKTLLKAGAASVSVVTLARVVRPLRLSL